MKLVIVESPAKCKKIEEYLGEPYKCMASYGHLRVLKELSQIDAARGYKVTYADDPAARKRQQVSQLRKAISAADEVILATDDDREGEAIAWHICDMFGLPIATTPRAVFHEITKNAVCAAVASPRRLNMAMVAAQQARQVIDLLVGFKITPLLWRNVCANRENPLSAGRCQTPALRLIYDNEQCVRDSAQAAIAAHGNTPKYRIVGYFTSQTLPFELAAPTEVLTPIPFLEAERAANDHQYVGATAPTVAPHQPPRPFTTSRLQQAAGGAVKETMKTAQTLYESGHITYMRTDAQTYSAVFTEDAKTYIAKRWGADYAAAAADHHTTTITAKPLRASKKGAGATAKPQPQEAHEAIRPTHIEFTPEQAKAKLDPRASRLYELIWTNTVKSLMPPAQVATYTASIISPVTKSRYIHTCAQTRFMGWKIVDGPDAGDSPEWDFLLRFLPSGQLTPFKTITARPTFETPPPHHTEAGLVKMLEEMGIGRPSTFAMLVDKIQERDYVTKGNIAPQKRRCIEYVLNHNMSAADAITSTEITKEVGGERGKLLLQPIGRIVSDFLNAYFAPILNYEYTCEMEKALDDVAAGVITMSEVCARCDAGIGACISVAASSAVKIHHVFKKGVCELIVGRQGPVIRITSPVERFVPLKAPFGDVFDLAMFEKIRNGVISLGELVNAGELAGINDDFDNGDSVSAPLSTATVVDLGAWGENKHLYVKTGKFGPYVSIMTIAPIPSPAAVGRGRRKKAPSASAAENKTLKPLGIRPIQQYTREEVIDLLEGRISENPNILRKITPNLSIRRGPKGTTYIYYKTDNMKKPAFYKLKGFLEDPVECPDDVLIDWIHLKYPATANKQASRADKG